LYSAASSLAHSADLKVRQFSERELVILHWRSIANARFEQHVFWKRGLRGVVPFWSLFYGFTRSTPIRPSHAAFLFRPFVAQTQGIPSSFGPASLAVRSSLYSLPVES
jgi:hypothetical protein